MNSDNKLLEICIPTYNRPKQLATLLTSIRRIDTSQILIHISENPCNNRWPAEQIIRHFIKYLPIKYTKQPHNIGGGQNFFFLLNNCQAKYFWPLPDDYRIACSDSSLKSILFGQKTSFAIVPDFTVNDKSILRSEAYQDYDSWLVAWAEDTASVGFPFYSIYNKKLLVESSHIKMLRQTNNLLYYNEGPFLHSYLLSENVVATKDILVNVDTTSTYNNNLTTSQLLQSFSKFLNLLFIIWIDIDSPRYISSSAYKAYKRSLISHYMSSLETLSRSELSPSELLFMIRSKIKRRLVGLFF